MSAKRKSASSSVVSQKLWFWKEQRQKATQKKWHNLRLWTNHTISSLQLACQRLRVHLIPLFGQQQVKVLSSLYYTLFALCMHATDRRWLHCMWSQLINWLADSYCKQLTSFTCPGSQHWWREMAGKLKLKKPWKKCNISCYQQQT